MKKIELLLPSGDLEKLKYALSYGADACYIGGHKYSLRAQASNFTLDDIKEACKFAHNLGKKVYVTVNALPLEEELDGVVPYLHELEDSAVDGIIVSSPAIIKLAKENTSLHISLSTQASSINSESVNFYKKLGVNRVVLGREDSLADIESISKNTSLELEVFIHGGMCSSISGRCTLSNHMSLRDANRGGCAHSCRWNYDLFCNGEKVNQDNFFQFASKDLCAMRELPRLIDAGIDSLKIEGRMKSIHYVATLAYTYRMLIDDYQSGSLKEFSFYENIIKKCENRETYSGFLEGISEKMNLYQIGTYEASKDFMGIVCESSFDNKCLIEVRNYFKVGDKVEVMSPLKPLQYFVVDSIYSEEEGSVSEARHALEKVIINAPIKLNKFDILRKA